MTRVLCAVSLGTSLALAACSSPPPPAPAAHETATPAAPAGVKPEVSINAVMVALVDHAGHNLWDVERKGKAPKTDAQWKNVEEHAVQLVAAGPAIAAGGTGPSDGVWVKSAAWQADAQKLSDAASAAVKAAQAKDLESLVKANGQIVEACESCHKEFKPELPTEGITHTHVD
jgi:hypothetical protein